MIIYIPENESMQGEAAGKDVHKSHAEDEKIEIADCTGVQKTKVKGKLKHDAKMKDTQKKCRWRYYSEAINRCLLQ